MDNFEWTAGYSQRFGLAYLDFLHLERQPKDSFFWYRDVIHANGSTLETPSIAEFGTKI